MNKSEIIASVAGFKDMAKELALSLARIGAHGDIDLLHAKSLDLLMGLTELEGKLSQPATQEAENFYKEATNSSFDEDQEVKKLKNRLPRWKNNPTQINSKILTLFLKLRKGGAVKVEALRNAYGNQSEFDKNFPQMKMISERNHGKVFEVTDGVVDIWPKVAELVEKFSE